MFWVLSSGKIYKNSLRLLLWFISLKQSTWKIIKKGFCFTKKAPFVYEILHLTHFFPVGRCWDYRRWLKINLQVYEVIMCQKRDLKKNCLISWEVTKVWQWNLIPLIQYYIQKIFMDKICRKCGPETSSISLFNLGK